MANTICLISKKYIDTNSLITHMDIASQKLKKEFRKLDDDFPININIFDDMTDEYLDIYIRDLAGYNRSFNNLNGIHDYGILVEIDYKMNEKLVVPFLRIMLHETPELLAYDEESPKGIDCHVYNKHFFDNNQGNDYYAIINENPPKSLNDLG